MLTRVLGNSNGEEYRCLITGSPTNTPRGGHKAPMSLWLALDYMVTTWVLVLESGSCHLSFNTDLQDFPGSLVVEILCFHCEEHGELRSHMLSSAVKKKADLHQVKMMFCFWEAAAAWLSQWVAGLVTFVAGGSSICMGNCAYSSVGDARTEQVTVLSRHLLRLYWTPLLIRTWTTHCHCSCVFRYVHGSQAGHAMPSGCHAPGSLLTLPLDISPLWNVLSLPVCQLLLLLMTGIDSYTWAGVFFPDETNFIPIRKKTYFFPSVD